MSIEHGSLPSSVMILENNADVRELLGSFLEWMGSECRLHTTLTSAIEDLGGSNPDLIISDLELDDGPGFDLLAASRRQRSDRPVVLISSYATEALRVRALEEGAIGLLAKPFKIEHLLALIDHAAAKV